jgi:hypothetical protein
VGDYKSFTFRNEFSSAAIIGPYLDSACEVIGISLKREQQLDKMSHYSTREYSKKLHTHFYLKHEKHGIPSKNIIESHTDMDIKS